MPQPDLALLRRREDFYRARRPGPADILLLIEVSDTSLDFDRTVKLPRYAKAGLPEIWIVDLKRHVMEVYRDPAPEAYRDRQTYRPGDRIALAADPAIVVTLGPIFGPPLHPPSKP